MMIVSTIAVGFALISIVISLISISVHLLIPKLLKHPGEFIFIQTIAQLFLDVHWLSALDSFWE